MHIEQLRDYCVTKNGVSEELPFGPDTLVFKVGGKVFLLVGLDEDAENLRFNVKCDPEYAVSLREEFEQTVVPGYHMNKKHWNTVYCNRELSDNKLKELIDHSYLLVYESLSKKQREEIK